MRYIQALTDDEKTTLNECQKNHKKSHVRNRSHALILSGEGKRISYLSNLFKVRTRTIYEWFNRWESAGIVGVMLKPGRGCKAKLDTIDATQQEFLKKEVELNPQKLDQVASKVSSLFGFKVTKNTLKSYLKKN